MEKLKVEQVFDIFSKVKALVIGDVMVDSYLWGSVDRISSEAPIPIVSVGKQENRLGGAANVALNLQALGATPVLVSLVGNDIKGTIFTELLQKHQLSDVGISITKNRPTTVKTRILSGKQQVVRVDEEITDLISSEQESLIFQRIESLIKQQKFDIIIFVDYDKGIITKGLIETITELAHSNDILIAVDPGLNSSYYRIFGTQYMKAKLFA